MPDVKAEIARYLETGESDPIFSAWRGDVLERCRRGSTALCDALIQEVQQRTRGHIDFGKRETFAYACEALSRLLALGRNRSARERLLGEHDSALPGDKSVDVDEYLDILREAIAARNGWKRILSRCAPLRVPSRPAGGGAARTSENTETRNRDRP